jgi:hypothetical protein
MNDVTYLPIGDLLASLPSDAVIRVLVPTAIEGGNAFNLQEQFVFANKLSQSGKLTITPVVTSAAGSCGDMDIMWTKQGNIITMHFFARPFTIEDTTTTTTVTVDLASTDIAPTSNFTGGFQLTGDASVSDVNQAEGVVQSSTVTTVTSSKKLQFSVNLTSAASGDFETTIGGSIAFEIVAS